MSFRILLSVLTVCSFLTSFNAQKVERWLQSTRYTNFGDWGEEQLCPPDSWVSSMNLKIEGVQGQGDDTALNSIQLTCTNFNGDETATISSLEGPWGEQRGRKFCDGYATGFQLKSESNQGSGDDTGAVNLKLSCFNFDTTKTEITGWDLPWGDWTEYQRCPPRTAICGIRTQVEGSQGRGDDTSLNNADFACCKVSHPADNCTPTKKWKTIIGCHKGIADCQVAITTGLFTNAHETTNVSNSVGFHDSYGTSPGAEYTKGLLKASVGRNNDFGTETINGKTLQAIVDETSTKETQLSFKVGCVGLAQELVVVCGPYELGTNELQCLPDTTTLTIPTTTTSTPSTKAPVLSFQLGR